MKKTFKLSHPKIKKARLFESTKHEIKKYFKRERNKPLPVGVDYWDFECKFGDKEEIATEVHYSEINKLISAVESNNLESFYVDILAKPGIRSKKESERDVENTLED